jgi:hypothetical protein
MHVSDSSVFFLRINTLILFNTSTIVHVVYRNSGSVLHPGTNSIWQSGIFGYIVRIYIGLPSYMINLKRIQSLRSSSILYGKGKIRDLLSVLLFHMAVTSILSVSIISFGQVQFIHHICSIPAIKSVSSDNIWNIFMPSATYWNNLALIIPGNSSSRAL